MAKSRYVYVCSKCGSESPKWNGRCPSCGSWNTLEEELIESGTGNSSYTIPNLSDEILELADIGDDTDVRYNTGIGELDRVLGGGLVKGSLVLLGGEPGIGKSTLLLQICQFLGENHSVLYVSGEESARQLKLRAARLGVDSENLYILTATDAEAVAETIASSAPDIAIIDSVQTMSIGRISSSPGSLTQVRECSNLFMHTAKKQEIPIIIVGHVNKDGAIAGPKVMEHIVDAVLYFEGERHQSYRLLRAVKNRFGSTNEIGVFSMTDKGLEEVSNPSATLLEGRQAEAPGSAVVSTIEGSRGVLAEIQALVAPSGFGNPRRMANGIDYNRFAMLTAVLERRAGIKLYNTDIYVNVAGGLKVDEPAVDLGICIAIASASLDRPITKDVVFIGEVGLNGELRTVTHLTKRLSEASKMGFKTAVVPQRALKNITPPKDIKTVGIANLSDAIKILRAGE